MAKQKGTIGANAVALETDDFQSAVARGNVYSVANQTGVATQAGLSATTPVLTLANPAGSGRKGRLWYAGATFNVVFAAIAAVFVAVGTNTVAAVVTGTKTTAHRRTRLGGVDDQGNAIQPFLAATLPAAPVAIAILGSGSTGAVVIETTIKPLERWFNGAIEIMPGTNLSIQTLAASGAVGTLCEYIWEEVDL